MKDQSTGNPIGVDHLIDAITKKLQANRQVLGQSLSFGRLGWRFNRKKDEIEVDLELKL